MNERIETIRKWAEENGMQIILGLIDEMQQDANVEFISEEKTDQ